MNWKVNRNSILWLIGVILIGIASNAIWEFLFKPLLLFTQNSFLTLTTLGIQEFKNTAYVEIAKANYDRAGLYLLSQFVYLSDLLVVASIVILFLVLKEMKKRHRELSSRPRQVKDNEIQDDVPGPESLKSRLAQLDRNYQQTVKWFTVGAALALLFVITNFTFAAREQYIVSAVLHFEQLLEICAPYLEENKMKLLSSKFAQIKNRNEYERIIFELRSIAEENGQSVPKFDIW